MSTVQLTQLYITASPAIFDECDRLMNVLLQMESQDSRVYDAAVSADAAQGIVEVEVVADAESDEEAEEIALTRVHDAVASVVQLEGDRLRMQQKRVTYA